MGDSSQGTFERTGSPASMAQRCGRTSSLSATGASHFHFTVAFCVFSIGKYVTPRYDDCDGHSHRKFRSFLSWLGSFLSLLNLLSAFTMGYGSYLIAWLALNGVWCWDLLSFLGLLGSLWSFLDALSVVTMELCFLSFLIALASCAVGLQLLSLLVALCLFTLISQPVSESPFPYHSGSQSPAEFDFEAAFDFILAPCSFPWWDYAGMPDGENIASTVSLCSSGRSITEATSTTPKPSHGTGLITDTHITFTQAYGATPVDTVRQENKHLSLGSELSSSPTPAPRMTDLDRNISQHSGDLQGYNVANADISSIPFPGAKDTKITRQKTPGFPQLVSISPTSSGSSEQRKYKRRTPRRTIDQRQKPTLVSCRVPGCPKLSPSKRSDEYADFPYLPETC